MRQKVFRLAFTMVITILCLSTFNERNMGIADLSYSSTRPTIAELPVPSLHFQNIMTKHFLKDAKMPIGVYEKFKKAIHGDAKAQKWLHEYDDKNKSKYFSVLDGVFPFRNGQTPYLENECYYNIGILYYDGNKNNKSMPLKRNKYKALYWFNLSANKGSLLGAVQAGDMVKCGDGISINKNVAFNLYKKALQNKIHGTAYERLAYCYENGIGTNIDKGKAQEYYFKSTLDGNPQGLYKMSTYARISQTQSILFSKAASSMDYFDDYFDMAYGGLDGYSAKDSKLKLITRLTKAWDNGTDPVVLQLKKSIREDNHFSKDFIEALMKTSYTYSYHAFAEKYGIKPNRNFKDGKNIKFDLSGAENEFDKYAEITAKQYLEYNNCPFYELDFDGDGKNEIGIPLLSGAGGAFMEDGFGIFKKNKKGLYEECASGPDCTLRDAMRLIKYKGRIYFITNPFSDTMNDPHNITAHFIDKSGQGYGVSIICSKYKPKEIMTQVYNNYNSVKFTYFIKKVMKQAYEAIAATKKQKMYNPNVTKPIKLAEKPQYDSSDSLPVDVYFAADINNDNIKEFIRKGHIITQSKYYDDYNLFQIYDSESKLLKTAKPMLDILPQDEYYGLHSGGNIYDVLPIGGKIIQFWTCKKDKKTYCAALTRNELLYALHIYTIENEKAIPVCDSLLFDEVQDFILLIQ